MDNKFLEAYYQVISELYRLHSGSTERIIQCCCKIRILDRWITRSIFFYQNANDTVLKSLVNAKKERIHALFIDRFVTVWIFSLQAIPLPHFFAGTVIYKTIFLF
jgi:hypothetical protein